MSFFKRIFAAIAAFFCALFPFLSKGEASDPNTYKTDGSTLEVYVSANPSTGYTWEYEIYGDCVELKSNEWKSNVKDEDVVGAYGITTFVFEGKSEGSFEINMQYLRTWEDKIPAQRISITGTVDKDGIVTVTEFNTSSAE